MGAEATPTKRRERGEKETIEASPKWTEEGTSRKDFEDSCVAAIETPTKANKVLRTAL